MVAAAKLGIWERPNSGTVNAGSTTGTTYAATRPYYVPSYLIAPLTGNVGVFMVRERGYLPGALGSDDANTRAASRQLQTL